MPDWSEHLTVSEIDAVLDGLGSERALEHLKECAACREETENSRDWHSKMGVVREGDFMPDSENCPDPAELAAYIAGTDSANIDRISDHIAQCDRCGLLVAMATSENAGIDESMRATLNTARPEWRASMAASCLTAQEAPSRPAVRPFRALRPAWLLAAAVLIVAAAGTIWWRTRTPEPARLLAMAYTSARPFEYRLPDEGYGPVRKQRSASASAFDRPESLARAEFGIRQRLSGDGDDPELLLLKGRAELLENQVDSAISDLERAVSVGHGAEAEIDLATAYALRGDEQQHNGDYAHALDLLRTALKQSPGNLRAQFNLAITCEKLSLIDDAINEWHRFLSAAPAGPWAAEARTRLEEVEKKKKGRQTALDNIPDDPRAFLESVRSSKASFDAEDVQNTFWSRWLPASMSDPAALQAATLLANVWVQRFSDWMLKDALTQVRAAKEPDLLQSAGSVIVDNIHGRNDSVLSRADDLVRRLRSRGQAAAAMRIGIELAYSWRRSTHHEPCIAILDGILNSVDSRRYPWIESRARIERSVCVGRAGDMGAARREREEVAREAAQRGFAGLELHASQLATSIDALSGNGAAVWETAPKDLAVYWSSAVPESRAQQGLYDMSLAARAMGWKEAAVAAESAAVRAIVRWDNPELEAVNRVYLATLLEEADNPGDAVQQLKLADACFRRLPPGPTAANLILDGQLKRAQAEAEEPDPRTALRDLSTLIHVSAYSSLEDRMLVQQTEGVALARTGDWHSAEDCFRQSMALAGEHIRSFSKPLSRIAASEMGIDSRRYLVEIELTQKDDPPAALRTWEERWNDLSQRTPAPRDAMIDPASAVLTFVVLPGGVAAFFSDPGGVSGRMLELPAEQLKSQIVEFHRLCSSPASSPELIRAAGHSLFRILLGPYAGRVDTARRLLFETDQWSSLLPFRALVDDSGHWLGERHSVGNISSLADASGAAPDITAATDALIVAAPNAGANSYLPVLAGAIREAHDLASRMTSRPVVIENASEAPDVLSRRMSQAGLVHFAGHGWANGGNAALITGSNESGEPEYLTASGLAELDWRRCHLAVLSACLTAAGESRGPVNPQSLTRALLAGGAQRVMASRWSIDEESTVVLMRRFYDSLFRGVRPVDALRTASTFVRNSRGWEHPYYWAAFDVFGAL